jgi:hypothetical protein
VRPRARASNAGALKQGNSLLRFLLVEAAQPPNTKTQMRKLKIMEHISLDGVIQHSADDGDFPHGDWTAPYRTPAGGDAILAAYGGSFDLLLGRRT